ncbi:entericidin [Burkholderia pseudomallei]|nr:entericidin [Burkholderia pseudomallei]PNW89326.1 entericidin [Burkholderia pseudomallei]PNW89327.1 entericidin [Burkholderia pseudomallei]
MNRAIAAALLILTAALAGCTTIAGAVQDIPKAGQAIPNTPGKAT